MPYSEQITNRLPPIGPGLMPDTACWYALQTRPRYERKIAQQLQEKSVGVFLPLLSAKHQWSDRQCLVHSPLFPGYVFIRISPTLDNRVQVLRTNGVVGFVGVRGMGTPIADEEIGAVQAVLDGQIPVEAHPYLSVGQRVSIHGGSLDGIQGVLTAIKGDQSLVVSIELIQRSIAIRIQGFQVRPI